MQVVDQVCAYNPDIIFLNMCYFAEAVKFLNELKKRLTAKIIIRIHHDVRYLLKLESTLEFMSFADKLVVPTVVQANFLRTKLSNKVLIEPVCFGVDTSLSNSALNGQPSCDVFDLVTAANPHPARNYRETLLMHTILKMIGYKTLNLYQLDKHLVLENLRKSRFFLLTSLTEASGSRILLEAIDAGCIPIVLSECDSATELLNDLQFGQIIESNIIYKVPSKKTKYSYRMITRVLPELIKVLRLPKNELVKKSDLDIDKFVERYSEETEIETLNNAIFQNS
jgi:glycosyltransferase involved in cell wall biosynthesis